MSQGIYTYEQKVAYENVPSAASATQSGAFPIHSAVFAAARTDKIDEVAPRRRIQRAELIRHRSCHPFLSVKFTLLVLLESKPTPPWLKQELKWQR